VAAKKSEAASERIDVSNELVKHVPEQRTLVENKARAGIFRLVKWWFTVMSDTTHDTLNQS
jgi:hypothetical protein